MVGNINKKALLFLLLICFLKVLQAQEVTLQFIEGIWVDNNYIEKMEKDKTVIGYNENLEPIYRYNDTLIVIEQYRSGYRQFLTRFASQFPSNDYLNHIPSLQEIKNFCENESISLFYKDIKESSYFMFEKIMYKDGKYYVGTRDISVPLLHMEKAPIWDGKDIKAFAKVYDAYLNSMEYKKYLEQDKINVKYIYKEKPWFTYIDDNTIKNGGFTYIRVR